MDLNVLVMAAGLGTRMKSRKAKVLHEIAGRSLISSVYQTAVALSPQRIIVIVGHQAAEVEKDLLSYQTRIGSNITPEFIYQAEQHGTGHAVMMAQEALSNNQGAILVLSGDVPLIKPATLHALYKAHQESHAVATVLTTQVPDATGYGRVTRNTQGDFQSIIEHRDANAAQLSINEINAGIYCFDNQALFQALKQISPVNAQGEYYLTDVLSVLRVAGRTVGIYQHDNYQEVLGINNRIELAVATHKVYQEKLHQLMLNGVTIIDPQSTYIASDVEIGMDSVIYPHVTIEGKTVIGADCYIGAGAHIINSQLGDQVTIKDYCLVVDSQLANETTVGPFAHLRMHTKLAQGATVGNFVEVKKSQLGERTKAMHLSYLGDATIGQRVNIGAGTITCNYDGKNKHATIIEDNVKIGSDTMLVAPVTIGQGSMTGAGTVVTKDVPPDSLAVGVPARIKKNLVKAE